MGKKEHYTIATIKAQIEKSRHPKLGFWKTLITDTGYNYLVDEQQKAQIPSPSSLSITLKNSPLKYIRDFCLLILVFVITIYVEPNLINIQLNSTGIIPALVLLTMMVWVRHFIKKIFQNSNSLTLNEQGISTAKHGTIHWSSILYVCLWYDTSMYGGDPQLVIYFQHKRPVQVNIHNLNQSPEAIGRIVYQYMKHYK